MLAAIVMVIMYPHEAKALMRLFAIVLLNRMSSKADTLIETAASLHFANTEFLMADDFLQIL